MNICLCIATKEPQRWRTLAHNEPLVELRADLMELHPEEVAEVVGLCQKAIFTYHTEVFDDYAERLYMEAIGAHTWAVDIDLLTPTDSLQRVINRAHEEGCKVILSRHYPTTLPLEELISHAREAFESGCDIAKIVTTATTTSQALVPLGLYDHFEQGSIVAFAMGESGSYTRRLSLLCGAPYTYATPSAEESTAVGQPTIEALRQSLNGGTRLQGLTLPLLTTLPSSKSEAQRAIVIAALREGTTTINNYTACGDTLAAEGVAAALVAKISRPTATTITIEGKGTETLRQQFSQGGVSLNVGESALLARIILPVAALLGGGCEIVGSGSLLGRQLKSDMDTLAQYGAQTLSQGDTLPIKLLSGVELTENEIHIDGHDSSQSITGWMIALAMLSKGGRIEVKDATSRPYIALTAKILSAFGVDVKISYCQRRVSIEIGSQGCKNAAIDLSGDWSSAAYFATAYAIAQSGYKPTERYTLHIGRNTLQADEAIIEILRLAGAHIESCDGGLCFLPSAPLVAFDYDATDSPDLIPTLAVLALYSRGTSRIGGLSRLSNKESNRTEAIVESLVALGAKVSIEGDKLVVFGGCKLRPAPLMSHNDHRMVMAMSIASLFMPQAASIDSREAVSKSFPTFFDLLESR